MRPWKNTFALTQMGRLMEVKVRVQGWEIHLGRDTLSD